MSLLTVRKDIFYRERSMYNYKRTMIMKLIRGQNTNTRRYLYIPVKHRTASFYVKHQINCK